MKHARSVQSAAVAATLLARAALAGGPVPPNDDCTNAIVIPGNVATFNPALLITTGATNHPCEANETCESGGAGSSNSVWYRYTPDVSGTVDINTFGSTTYNTVLSIWTGCPSGTPPLCLLMTQLACNDDAVGNLSQIFFNVTAGVTYRIKVADYNFADGGGTLDFNLRWIPPNNACASATHVNSANFHPPPYNTFHADIDSCEANESCEVNGVGVSNSVWYKFCSLESGTMTVSTNGSTYDTVLSIFNGCATGISPACSFPVELACDDDGGVGLQSLIQNFPITAGMDYYIKVADYNPSPGGGPLQFNLDFQAACASDTNGDGEVDVDDLINTILAWGACP